MVLVLMYTRLAANRRTVIKGKCLVLWRGQSIFPRMIYLAQYSATMTLFTQAQLC
ncbi:hypothetical protein Sbal183_2066 [Shewanella baltica OS183]|nr:hypothetical protein Sbal175_2237 [Shewanella baltica BA175]EHQ14977.1 hypothetical protein Sbal183_2066 [Shewanella baltica OS183]